MDSRPFFSITIPAYNRAYILEETLESIQNQLFKNWEVIIVDDGSTDNTREVVNALSLKDPRIRYVYQENAERSAARNRGAKHAKGSYLLFLDSDDAFREDHLEKFYALIQHNNFPVCMLFSNLSYLTKDGLKTPKLPFMQEGKEFEYVLMQPITPSRVCIHKDVFKDFQFDPKIVIVEDLVLWVCIASKYRVFQVPEPTLNYRIHDGNSVDLSRNSYLDRYKGLQRLFDHEEYKSVSALISKEIKKHLLAECTFNMARHFEYVKNSKATKRMLWLSFKHKSNYRNKERLFMMLNHSSMGKLLLKFAGKSTS